MKFPKLFLMIFCAIFLISNSDAQFTGSNSLPSLSNQIILNQDSTISEDAIILTLRMQNSIKLDSLLAFEINQVLELVRAQFDSLRFIHAMIDYTPNQLLLKSNAPWIRAWRNGEIMTGNSSIDSLSTEFQMIDIEVNNFDSTLFTLYFLHPLKMPLLVKLYESIQDVEYAQPNWVSSIGIVWNDIGIFWSGNWNIIFGYGVLSRCNYCWLLQGNIFSGVRLLAEENPIPGPSATFFSSADDLLFTAQFAQSDLARIRAVEVIGLLFINKCPWSRVDIRNFASFCNMKEVAYFMREQVVEVLIRLLGSPNPSFQYSIQIALNRVLDLEGGFLSYYFPLKKGNYWIFLLNGPQKESIIDTLRVIDSLYFCFDHYRNFPDVSLRMTSNNNLLVRHNLSEQLWLDFSANIGDNWKATAPSGGSEWTVHLQSKTDTVTVPAGTFTNCYRFWFQFNGADNDWVEWYAPGVGPVRRILYGFAVIDYPLTSAYVNGFYLPTKIDEQRESSKPDQFHLYPNYPNPFNAITVIPFDLSHSSDVTLEIYNIIGKKVRTLLAALKPGGRFEVQWDGTDEWNQAVASGIYLCRMQATNPSNEAFVQARKLILLR